MLKRLLFLMALGFSTPAYAQQPDSVGGRTEPMPTTSQEPATAVLKGLAEKMDVNFLLRSSLEVPSGRQNQGGVRLNEARMEVRGNLLPELSYRFRFRMNRSFAPQDLDNAPSAIDHASATYRFGPAKRWNLTVGKQAAAVGSWEFDKNPTFEYQYSEYVNRQLNLFLLAAKLGYDINDQHSVVVQLHNTANNSFASRLNGAAYAADGLRPAKVPVGLYAAWQGRFFEKKLLTYYSYNVSQFAEGKTNHSVSLGNKVVLKRFEAYLDLASTAVGVDYFNVASPAINAHQNALLAGSAPVFAQGLRYNNAIVRLDYEFTPGWFVTGKGIWEASSNKDDASLGQNFRQHVGYLAGLEYKPVKSQDMRLFGYYYRNQVRYQNPVADANPNTDQSLFAVGLLYFINAF